MRAEPGVDLTAERHFLLRLIGGQADVAAHTLASESRAIDWTTLLDGVSPFLYPYVDHCIRTRLSDDAVPRDARERIAKVAHANALFQLSQRHELKRALGALENGGIPVLVLKGMAVAFQLYPAPAARSMVDIDLLIHPEDSIRARSRLEADGFRVPERYVLRPASGIAAAEEHEKPFERPGTAVLIEVHVAMSPSSAAEQTASAWRRAVPTVLAGTPASVLHPHDLLVNLCLHCSSQHLFAHGLRPLVDILLLVERHRHDIDWDGLAAESIVQTNQEWIHLTLKLARDLLAAPVPQRFLDALRAPARLAEAEHLAVEQLLNASSVEIPFGVLWMLAMPRLGEKIRQGARLINPWRREDIGPRGALTGLRRLVADTSRRTPRLFDVWRRGELSGANVREAVRLYRGRDRLAALLDGHHR